jgi:hypothetical protein
MAAKFGNVAGETGFGKQAGDFRAQSAGGEVGFDQGTSKYVPCLFFHTAAIFPGAALQPRLNLTLNVADNELGQGCLPVIMIS